MLNFVFLFFSLLGFSRERVKISDISADKTTVTFNTGNIVAFPHDLVKVAEDCVVEISTVGQNAAVASTDLCINKSKLRLKKTGYYVALDDKITHTNSAPKADEKSADKGIAKEKIKEAPKESEKEQEKEKNTTVEYVFIDRAEPSHFLIGASLGYMKTKLKTQLGTKERSATTAYGFNLMYFNKLTRGYDWSYKISYQSSDTSWANNELSIYYPLNSRWKLGAGIQLATLISISYEDNPPSGLGTGAQATLYYKWNGEIFLSSSVSTVLFSSDKISQPDIHIYGINFSIHKIIFE